MTTLQVFQLVPGWFACSEQHLAQLGVGLASLPQIDLQG
jgi:hypothetical protein